MQPAAGLDVGDLALRRIACLSNRSAVDDYVLRHGAVEGLAHVRGAGTERGAGPYRDVRAGGNLCFSQPRTEQRQRQHGAGKGKFSELRIPCHEYSPRVLQISRTP